MACVAHMIHTVHDKLTPSTRESIRGVVPLKALQVFEQAPSSAAAPYQTLLPLIPRTEAQKRVFQVTTLHLYCILSQQQLQSTLNASVSAASPVRGSQCPAFVQGRLFCAFSIMAVYGRASGFSVSFEGSQAGKNWHRAPERYCRSRSKCMSSARALTRTQLLAESWTTVAQQYEKRLAPLFQPWLDQLVGALDAEQLPEGPVIVPACGPGMTSEH